MIGRTNTALRIRASEKEIAILKKTLDILCYPEHWTKGVEACDIHKNQVEVDNDDAHCFCLSGAVRKAILDEEKGDTNNIVLMERCMSILYSHIPSGHHDMVTDFNDHPDTTYQDVVSVLRSAINYSKG